MFSYNTEAVSHKIASGIYSCVRISVIFIVSCFSIQTCPYRTYAMLYVHTKTPPLHNIHVEHPGSTLQVDPLPQLRFSYLKHDLDTHKQRRTRCDEE